MIALDTTALSLLFLPDARIPSGKTGKPIEFARERMSYLVDRSAKANDVILIPTPALSELFVKLDQDRINALLKEFRGSRWFRIGSFDEAAAVEAGVRTAKAISDGDKRGGLAATWAKVKFDRQILAIAGWRRAGPAGSRYGAGPEEPSPSSERKANQALHLIAQCGSAPYGIGAPVGEAQPGRDAQAAEAHLYARAAGDAGPAEAAAADPIGSTERWAGFEKRPESAAGVEAVLGEDGEFGDIAHAERVAAVEPAALGERADPELAVDRVRFH